MGEKEQKKYERVAPDGGWGYMVALGVILNLTTMLAFVNCFGMIFKEFFILTHMDSANVTLFNGIGAMCVAIAGFVTGPLLKLMSLRQLGLVAALLFNIGILSATFVRSQLLFFICLGVLQGTGSGMIFNISCTMLNNYFVKKRLLAFSFTQTIVCVSTLVSPQFVKWSQEMYGYRGTLLLISAVSLHNLIGMSLMQPVEWHMKKIEVVEEKEKEMLLLSDSRQINVNVSEKLEKEKEDIEDSSKKPTAGVQGFLSRYIDVPLYKKFLFSNASAGVALCAFADVTFSFMLPQCLYFMGWSEGEVARALSLNALGDLVTRILFIFMGSLLPNVGSHEIYVGGLVIAFVTRIGMLWSDNRMAMLCFITIMGASKCTITTLLPVVVADAVGQDKFTAAMGLLLLLLGLFNLTVGPIVGAIRDMTDSYATAFYILTSCFGIVVIFWSIELLYKKNKHKRQPKMDLKP